MVDDVSGIPTELSDEAVKDVNTYVPKMHSGRLVVGRTFRALMV